jgi:hypothetical protein
MNNDIIVTGPPRSGTTLTCFLLNKVEDTIALNEPMNLKMFPSKNEGIKQTQQFFKEMRASLTQDKTAIARQVAGRIPDNIFPIHQSDNSGPRKNIATKGRVRFDKELTSNFKLILKHNAHFTFLLDKLTPHYKCYAIIRNPVSTIASWNSIDAPVSRGNLNVLKSLDQDLYNDIELIPDLIDRQVFLLHKLFECYKNLSTANIIRYEDVVESGGKCLSVISDNANRLEDKLTSKNKNKLYDERLIAQIREKLLSFDGAFWQYYDKRDVIELPTNKN